ncbi:MAG: hypothetical protein WCD18_12550, partial [Thermosynechococcaceae cyanobacterium]
HSTREGSWRFLEFGLLPHLSPKKYIHVTRIPLLDKIIYRNPCIFVIYRYLKRAAPIIKLISHATTQQGLAIQAKLDKHQYKTGIKVSDVEFNAIALEKDPFHGDWNYHIRPRTRA